MRLVWTIIVSVVSFSPVAFSCSCVPSSGCPGLEGNAGPVLLGTVLAVADLPSSGDDDFLTRRMARIRVDESFAGVPPQVREVDVLTGAGGGDCGIRFKAGEVYLIDAFVGEDGKFHAGICSSTRKIDEAGVALRILRQQRDGQHLPSLAGRIAQYDRNFDGPLGRHAPKSLPNTLVRVKAEDGRVYETRADADGLYAFFSLPPGRYRFAPDLPPGTTLSWYFGSDEPLMPFELRGGCQEENIDVFAVGSIQGRVLDSSNNLLPHAFVYIIPAEEKVLREERQMYWESQGERRFFKFVHIPPGRYLIVVNPDDSRNPDFPYARTFYPGVHEREAASVITVRPGEEVKDADIRLDQQFGPRHLTVRITWADGRVIKDLLSVEAKGTVNPSAMSHATQPDMKMSVVDLSILPNEPYEVGAELICVYADERSVGPGTTLKSNRVFIGPREDRTELSLTMPGTACPDIPGKTSLNEQ